ncbi:MAG TPA: S9 family peptidase [Gemmatimonadaceae bacterium]|nr:S9 family peptidase [Gemmatimonadaceae bacterium]
MRTPLLVLCAAVVAAPLAQAQGGAAAAATQPAAAATSRATPRAFTPADWYRVTTLSSPAMSPDGRLVAFTVQTVNEKENKYHREVWVVPTAGGDPVRYTAPGTESSDPSFTPDGKYLVFTSSRPGGKGTRWALRMDQPGGEALQLPSYPLGSTPRDRSFAVWTDAMEEDSAAKGDSAKKNDPFAKMQATARPPFGAITRPLDPARFDGRHIVDIGYKANGRGFVPNRREPRRWNASQIWMQTLDGSPKKMLTSTPYSHSEVAVSPDGKWLAFVADWQLRPDSVVQAERDSLAKLPFDTARSGQPFQKQDIFIVPVAGGEPRRITDIHADPQDIAWSPDGKSIAYIARLGRTSSARIWVVGARGGEPVNILGGWKYEPDSFVWLENGDVFMSATVGGRTALFVVAPKTKNIREVIGGRRRVTGLAMDAARTKVAYVASSVDRPTELYVAGIDGKGERRLTKFNDALNAEIAWSPAERITYRSVGGLEIEGWLMKPYGYEPGKKYPLVLYIHGGPHSQYHEGWFDETQSIAGAGMWVLYTNPRGSSGYGADFTYATRGRWGAEDFEDLMKAVDIAAARPDVDSTRMGVTGGSYGGFMTAWVTTKTDRFKAAQTDRMISNWISWYGASDAQGLTEFEFYGKPWENAALYDTLSPIKHVDRVKTPTLIVQSEEDHRTPIADAEQWFMALRKRNVPVEFVRYPRSTHDLSRTGEPWLLVDRLARLRQWFGYWLLDQKVATSTR